jgi:DNA-binding SARP family transcriptional activator
MLFSHPPKKLRELITLKPLELVCFGSPTARLVGADSPAELRWHKNVALLVYLALSPSRSRSRDHLLGLLWAEQPERGARKALNMTISRLRTALGDERLRSESDILALSDDALEVDALRFLTQAQTAPEAALPLLRGEFLEGFHVKDAPEFEDWMTRERERYRALAASTLVTAGERRLAAGRLSEAADSARRALDLAPRSEPAVRLLMRAAALAGDSATALGAYKEIALRLEKELNEQPGRALVALAERVRTRTWLPAGTDTTSAAPIIGREQLHRLAFETSVPGRTLLITSPPGMGRSRLLAECTRRLALDGAFVLAARPVESDHDAPWSTLRLLVRAGIAEAPGLPAARRDALGALAGLAPELAERFPPREVRDVTDMATALSNVLRAIADERAVAIALDDAHWADGASLAALGAAAATLKDAKVTVLVTVAQGIGDPPRELLRFQSDVGRDIPGATVRLGALGESELAALVAALTPWCRDDEERGRLTRRIAAESCGNPFFAVTLLESLARASTLRKDFVAWPPPKDTLDSSLPFSIPSLVRHAIALRIAELQREEVIALCAASVCGQVLDPVLMSQVCDQPVAVIEGALTAFERRHLVQFDGRRYAFVAPIIADVVRSECLTRGQRRAYEQRACDALATRDDLDSRALRAGLMAHCRPDQVAYDLAIGTAAEALSTGARRIAKRMLTAADGISREAQLDRARLEELRARL